jgi:general secretion pathway protein I
VNTRGAISAVRHPEPCEGPKGTRAFAGILRTARDDDQRVQRVRPDRKGAFTLIEVLVSLGIFALAAIVLGTAYVNILTNYQAMRAWTVDKEELAFARATLLAEPDREKAEQGGEAALLAGGNIRWTAAIDETTRADLFRVTLDLEITPPPPAGPRREKQVFLLLRPTWSDPARREKLQAEFREQLAERKF